MILAAIDIGSNAARLLITEVKNYKDGTVDYTKLNLLRIPLRLGFDVFQTGTIPPAKVKKLVDTMKAYKLLLEIYNVEAIKACATSAMRDASNGPDIVREVKETTGIEINIISGSEEANIIYETHIAENMNSGQSYLYIDVGGGSTELTMFSDNHIVFKESFNIGTVRMLSNKVSDTQWEHMKWVVKNYTKDMNNIKAIGSGGNINKVFSISKRKEGRPLNLDLLKDYYKELSSSTVEERMHLYNLREDRADVIVPALQIYTTVMRWANADEIFVPKIGLADGLIKVLYAERTATAG
ncbi:exopolyphosphatase [Taibaiella chishuiensis]|uniref:Exopolyphosphatase/guanosine-5'-triphosphate, 3'-diphosphate pyrophosphatase n=1 Tax=Taibaiella chishuiensis TaxID=1434707 RepID=A0A2P8CWY2_9BACT|nr:exopolyphosphatase [Taibaiella chishuiensis]PSK89484.1 exopolyphosphatase/guanosine-5'-triphosphate,3'-diphosphate pyrophosphatase [Taibaiella chishuiensis]